MVGFAGRPPFSGGDEGCRGLCRSRVSGGETLVGDAARRWLEGGARHVGEAASFATGTRGLETDAEGGRSIQSRVRHGWPVLGALGPALEKICVSLPVREFPGGMGGRIGDDLASRFPRRAGGSRFPLLLGGPPLGSPIGDG